MDARSVVLLCSRQPAASMCWHRFGRPASSAPMKSTRAARAVDVFTASLRSRQISSRVTSGHSAQSNSTWQGLHSGTTSPSVWNPSRAAGSSHQSGGVLPTSAVASASTPSYVPSQSTMCATSSGRTRGHRRHFLPKTAYAAFLTWSGVLPGRGGRRRGCSDTRPHFFSTRNLSHRSVPSTETLRVSNSPFCGSPRYVCTAEPGVIQTYFAESADHEP
jgi:hypothetical protein